MVERPIKKSERLAKADAEPTGDRPSAAPTEERSSRPRGKDKGKGKGKGRGRDRDNEDSKPPVNPALVRGPRPTPPKPPAPEVEAVPAEDAVADESVTTDVEASTASEEPVAESAS